MSILKSGSELLREPLLGFALGYAFFIMPFQLINFIFSVLGI